MSKPLIAALEAVCFSGFFSGQSRSSLWLLLLMASLGACAGGNSAPIAEQGERQERISPIIVDSQNSGNEVLRSGSNPVRIIDSQAGGAARSGSPSQSSQLPVSTSAPGSVAIARAATPPAASRGGAIQRGGIIRQSIGRSSLPPAGRPITVDPEPNPLPQNREQAGVARAPIEINRAPVAAELPPPIPAASPSSYRVRAGDTLYSIAFQHDLDYRRLAAANGMSAPYTIFVDQQLSLDVSSTPAPVATNAAPEPASSRERSTPEPAALRSAEPEWVWPLDGQVVEEFSLGRNKGIDISGRLGDSVVAASGGDVVFSGRSVQGAGDLIIIRHNDKFLSAYAHNSSMTVNVGDRVTAGQKIAEVGLDPTGEPLLHFEIRRSGDSVDPRGYLP